MHSARLGSLSEMRLTSDPFVQLASVATAFPANVVDRATVVDGLGVLFPDEDRTFLEDLVERSGVETRHLVPSVAEVLAPSDFGARNRRYQEAAVELAERAAKQAIDLARMDPREIDVLIDVSCTGLVIPALDVALAPRLLLRSDVRRIPITESGCAAGALGLSLAATLARSDLRVLLVAVELGSLTLIAGDRARTNLVSSVIFGDGAAAALIEPAANGRSRGLARGPRFEALASHLIPNSQNAMGFDDGNHGLKIVLRRDLPNLLEQHLPRVVDAFLDANGRSRKDIGLHLVHPGGRRILERYEALFGLAPGELVFSRESLRRYGNLSSVSILTVLELALADGFPLPPKKEALLVGVGPGLSLELALLSTRG